MWLKIFGSHFCRGKQGIVMGKPWESTAIFRTSVAKNVKTRLYSDEER
jgi:hypothetical protein